jgi:hypothetical protein
MIVIKTEGLIKVLDLCQRVVFLVFIKKIRSIFRNIKDSIIEVTHPYIDLGQGWQINEEFNLTLMFQALICG